MQLECYRDVLARRFDLLAEPKRPRHSAQRTAEMRALCAELRKVTSMAVFAGCKSSTGAATVLSASATSR